MRLLTLLIFAYCFILTGCSSGSGGGPVISSGSLACAFNVVVLGDSHRSGAALNSSQDFSVSTGSVICSPQSIVINGGQYSIDGGPFTSASGTVAPNQRIVVRVPTASIYGRTTFATVQIGEANGFFEFVSGRSSRGTFSVTTRDGVENAPLVMITSPANDAQINDSVVRITGTAHDDDGVSSIKVNGHMVHTTDSFNTWHIELPLVSGANEFTVSSVDFLNATNGSAASLTIENTAVVIALAYDLAVDNVNQRILVLDQELDAIIAIDPVSNALSILSGSDSGVHPFVTPYRMVLDPSGRAAWVLDTAYEELMRVDLDTGDRSLIRPDDLEAFDLGRAYDMVYDMLRERVLMLFRGDDDIQILSMDPLGLSGGVVSGADVGEGAPFLRSRSLVIDETMDRIIVFQDHPGRPFEVNPVTGDRSKFALTESSDEMLQDWDFQIDAVFDPERYEIYIANHRFFRVDRLLLNTGEWIEAFHIPQPRVQRVALDAERHRVLVLNRSRAVYAIDLSTGGVERVL